MFWEPRLAPARALAALRPATFAYGLIVGPPRRVPQTRAEAPVALDYLCRRCSEAATDRTLDFPFDGEFHELASLISFQ